MVFNKIVKFADQHVQSMLKEKSMNRKKTAIAKYSFLTGFQTAMLLYGQNNDAPIHREEERKEDSHKSKQLSELALSNVKPNKETIPSNSSQKDT